MAHPQTAHDSGRSETIDSSGGHEKASGFHLTGYAGLAIAALILVAVLILQNMTGR